MNKEFEGLIAQISELESSHRKDAANLLAEQLQHQHTQKELDQALGALERQNSLVADLKKELGQVKASLSSERKINEQLKQTVRNAKHENQLLREHAIKVGEKMKAQREEFLQTINATNRSLREMRVIYSEQELSHRINLLETKNSDLQQEVRKCKDMPHRTAILEEQLAQITEQKQVFAVLVEELQTKL